jgi:hypothetical protein
MPIIASNTGGGAAELTPEGMHVARCYAMVHLGHQDDEWQGQKRITNKVRLSWELPNEMRVFDQAKGEQPMSVHKEFALSLKELSSLRPFLNSWRGKALTEEECISFDIEKLLGAPCMLNIIHEKSKTTGKTYAVIASISPLVKGMACPPQANASFSFSPAEYEHSKFETLPQWLQEKIQQSHEYRAMEEEHQNNLANTAVSSNPIHNAADDLPF